MLSRTLLATTFGCLLFFCAAFLATPALAQPPATNEMPSVIQVPAEAQPSAHFDATAATNAYLAQIPADKTARSDAYFEGGYWLILWDFLYGVVIALILLNLRWSARMRDLAERVTRFKPVHTFVYWVQYLVVATILGFPLSVYEDYFREHKYGLATQTFGPWMSDQTQGARRQSRFGRHTHDVVDWHRSQTSPNLVDLGSGCDAHVPDLHHADRSRSTSFLSSTRSHRSMIRKLSTPS